MRVIQFLSPNSCFVLEGYAFNWRPLVRRLSETGSKLYGIRGPTRQTSFRAASRAGEEAKKMAAKARLVRRSFWVISLGTIFSAFGLLDPPRMYPCPRYLYIVHGQVYLRRSPRNSQPTLRQLLFPVPCVCVCVSTDACTTCSSAQFSED